MNQNVHTTSSPTFAALTLSGALTAASGTNPIDGLQNTRIVVSGHTRPTYAGGIEYMATSTGNHVFSNAGAQTAVLSSTGLAVSGTLSATTGSFSGVVTASTAPSAGGHLTNKTKVGAVVIVSAEFTWTSASGTLVEADANTSISTMFNSTLSRSMNVVIQKDSFVSTKMPFTDEASPILKTRLNGSDMPGYTGGATLLFSWTYFTAP